jgi:hypothetical protein
VAIEDRKKCKNVNGLLGNGSNIRMSEIKIARFVDIEACKSIFSEKSTFVLRSPEHYRRLYEITAGGNTKGDRDEGRSNTIDGGMAEFTGFVVSCWTKLKGSEPTTDEWNIFKKNDQNIVAIVSTPSKVCDFLDKALETKKERPYRRFPFLPTKHKKVNYDKVHVDKNNIFDVVPFTKSAQFSEEQEYRFVLMYLWPFLIDSFIFGGGVDYMEKCFANPQIKKESKIELRLILDNAMAGYGDFSDKKICDIIANSDILFE